VGRLPAAGRSLTFRIKSFIGQCRGRRVLEAALRWLETQPTPPSRKEQVATGVPVTGNRHT